MLDEKDLLENLKEELKRRQRVNYNYAGKQAQKSRGGREELYGLIYPIVRSVCLKERYARLRRQYETDDLVQVCMERIFVHLPEWIPLECSLIGRIIRLSRVALVDLDNEQDTKKRNPNKRGPSKRRKLSKEEWIASHFAPYEGEPQYIGYGQQVLSAEDVIAKGANQHKLAANKQILKIIKRGYFGSGSAAQIYELRFIRRLRVKTIAQKLGCSVQQVNSLIQRKRAAMKAAGLRADIYLTHWRKKTVGKKRVVLKAEDALEHIERQAA